MRKSSIYETPSWGFEGADFLNQVLCLETVLSPEKLIETILNIEKKMRRISKKGATYEARKIDIDILYYGDLLKDYIPEQKTEHLSIPHPWLHKRKFILVPLNEIAPEKLHPYFKATTAVLLNQNKETVSLEKFMDCHEKF